MMETKYIFIISIILIVTFIYSFNLTRYLSFRLDDFFKWFNKKFWELMFLINRFFNNGYIRSLLFLISIIVLLYSIYYMFGVLN